MTIEIKLTLNEKFDRKLTDKYLSTMMETLRTIGCVTNVEITEDEPTRQFFVHYNDRYAKLVQAKDEETARELVYDKGQGEVVFFERETVTVEEMEDEKPFDKN